MISYPDIRITPRTRKTAVLLSSIFASSSAPSPSWWTPSASTRRMCLTSRCRSPPWRHLQQGVRNVHLARARNPASDSATRWLRAAANFRMSMRPIPSTSSVMMRLAVVGARFHETLCNHVHLWLLRDQLFMHVRDYRRDDVQELLGRAWILRAWTLQELVLSPNFIFVCGSQVFD